MAKDSFFEAKDYLRLPDDALLKQCAVDTFRGTGPGGQKRNKTSSAVRLRHQPTGLRVESDLTRSQQQNKKDALSRLRERIALEIRQPVMLNEYHPPEEIMRLFGPKAKRLGRHHADYLPAIAALLDLFVALDCSVRDTAQALGVSTGGLSKRLLADEHQAKRVNALRKERLLRPLR